MDQHAAAAAPPTTLYAHVDEFADYARNSNTHSDEQIELLKGIVRKFGWTDPIIKHGDLGLLAGHGRIRMAREMYAAGERIWMAPGREAGGYELPLGHVPWMDVTGWSADDARAFVLLHNQVGRLSKYDQGLLQSEFELLADDEPLLMEAFGDMAPASEETDADDGDAMPDAGPVTDEFWITLSGPLEKQAKALQTIRQALGLWPDLKVEQGVTRHG